MQYLNDNTEGNYYYSLSSITKGQIEDALWYTGAMNGEAPKSPLEAYIEEHGSGTGTVTTINYTTTWVGKVAIMYPSDFGYAGGCASIRGDCGGNNWLSNLRAFTISACQGGTNGAWNVRGGYIGCDTVSGNPQGIRPTMYLKSSIKIIDGDGTDSFPYRLSI